MKEVMIFARHTQKWEFAHKEPFDFGGKAEQWVRRDGIEHMRCERRDRGTTGSAAAKG